MPANSKLFPSFYELIAVVALLLLANVFIYWRILEPSRAPQFIGARDQWTFVGPNQFFLDASIHYNGEFPFWNPLVLCGRPYAADPQMLAFYPPNLLRSFATVNPTPLRTHIGLALMALAHILFGGLGSYCLARYCRLSVVPGIVAAIVTACSAAPVSMVTSNIVLFMPSAWMPWSFLFAFWALDANRQSELVRRSLCTGLVFLMLLLSGHPKFVIYICLFIALGTFAYALLPPRTDKTSLRSTVSSRFVRYTTFSCTAFGVSLAGSLVVTLPAIELASLSTRAVGSGLIQAGESALVFDNLGAVQSAVVEFPGGVGVGAAMMAAVGLCVRPSCRTVVYGCVLYVITDLVAGSPFPLSALLKYMLPATNVSNEYALWILPFPIAMLAAEGAHLRQMPAKGTFERVSTPSVLAVAYFASKSPDVDAASILSVVCAASLICGSLCSNSTRILLSTVCIAGVCVVSELCVRGDDVISIVYRFLPNPRTYEELNHRPKLSQGNERVAAHGDSEFYDNSSMYSLNYDIRGYTGLMIASIYKTISANGKETEYSRTVAADCLRSNQRWTLFLKRRTWLVSQYIAGALPPKPVAFPPTRVAGTPSTRPQTVTESSRDVIQWSAVSDQTDIIPINKVELAPSRSGIESGRTGSLSASIAITGVKIPSLHAALRVRYRSDSDAILDVSARNSDTGSMADLMRSSLHPTNGEDDVAELPLPDFMSLDLCLTVHRQSPNDSVEIAGAEIACDLLDEGRQLSIMQASTNSLTVHAHGLDGNRLLVFTEADYPGWLATVDGVRTEIVRVNDSFMGVELPPGDHIVQFDFRPWKVYAGLFISLTTVIVSATMVVSFRHAKHL